MTGIVIFAILVSLMSKRMILLADGYNAQTVPAHHMLNALTNSIRICFHSNPTVRRIICVQYAFIWSLMTSRGSSILTGICYC